MGDVEGCGVTKRAAAKRHVAPPLVRRDPRDPPCPEDGTCAGCGKPREPGRSRQYGHGAAELDPFCSSECARAWYGVPLPSSKHSLGVGYRQTPSPEYMRRGRYTERRA